MCEFTVFLENDGSREKIAKNVVKAKLKEGVVTLMDVGGNLTKVEKASILTVDTLMQELILKKET
ncbi:putative RNA-binding protein [Methanocella conradii HZ254]|uniref:RNA-binding protein n=1 Tax=Methanocella conradii (strain DSM 24694 / JCM 17849 / CGMCC 1.5162 / HZ254) TaxID=1041930 RepID=H8IAS4_METCZ|nr:CooT family nickel-binding protein [Methanocella conradii]AFD00579.1 putative RNA-binding protein [Methanocella conradii HZ254]